MSSGVPSMTVVYRVSGVWLVPDEDGVRRENSRFTAWPPGFTVHGLTPPTAYGFGLTPPTAYGFAARSTALTIRVCVPQRQRLVANPAAP